MQRTRYVVGVCCLFACAAWLRGDDSKLIVDKEKRSITIPCVVAQRKLPNLDKVYPLEVIATYPAPDGKKAHETVVSFKGIKPSDVHKALESLGLKPGKPAATEGAVGTGPELRVFLETTDAAGKTQRVPIEKTMSERRTGKPMPTLKWHFTGSAMKKPNPEKEELAFMADLSGTLITIFPVTDETVIQSNLKSEEQKLLQLETNKAVVPAEGTAVRLVIEVK